MPAPTSATLPVPITDLHGRLTITMLNDTTKVTTTGSSVAPASAFTFVSRLISNDATNTTKVSEVIEIGTNAIVGGVVGLGEYKGNFDREDVSTKLLGLVTGKVQNPVSTSTTTWLYSDLANAKFDYVRFFADPTGQVYGGVLAMDAVLTDWNPISKVNGDAMEKYDFVGPHLVYFRGYAISKVWLVNSTDVTNGYLDMTQLLGPNEVPILLPAPAANQPPSSLYSSGRRGFMKMELVPSTSRVIANRNYPAGKPIRIKEVSFGTAPATGQFSYDSAGTKHLLFGDALVAGDYFRMIFISYGNDSFAKTVTTTSPDAVDQPGIPTRIVYPTINAYAFPHLQDIDIKVNIPRKQVQGIGQDEIEYGTAGVPGITYSASTFAGDIDLVGLLASGSSAAGSANDIYDADYVTRYMNANPLPIRVDIKSPTSNTAIIKSYIGSKPVFESGGFSGASTGELMQKWTGKDLLGVITISATTP